MNVAARVLFPSAPAAVQRLQSTTSLDSQALGALANALPRTQRLKPGEELFREDRSVGRPRLVVDGWLARVRQLPDGRRQLVSFALPGDIVGYCQFESAVASCATVALNAVQVCALPEPGQSPSLARAYAISRALDEAYLMAQVTRLGRLNAHERTIDLLLEFYERLHSAGQAGGGSFRIPLTQETMADALGLTPVHLNRTLQQSRRAGELTWVGREVTLFNLPRLASLSGRAPAIMTEDSQGSSNLPRWLYEYV